MSVLLEQAVAAGLKLSAHGDQLRIQGPRNVLQHSTLIEEIKKHKSELLALLKDGGGFGSRPDDPEKERIRELVREEGRAFVVTVKDGRIRVVEDAKRISPDHVVSVWNYEKVRVGDDWWMVGNRLDRPECTAWSIKQKNQPVKPDEEDWP